MRSTHILALANILTDWWTPLTFAKQVFYGIALIAAVIVVLMGIAAMFGIGHDVELDAHDADGGGSLFSLKPITGFLLAFGWAGGGSLGAGLSLPVACLLALLAGLIVMFAIAALLRASQRLKVDGTIKKEDAIGKVATVYVTIPPAPGTGGQVIVPLDGRTITLGAIQTGPTPVPADGKVKVTALIDPDTARVEPI